MPATRYPSPARVVGRPLGLLVRALCVALWGCAVGNTQPGQKSGPEPPRGAVAKQQDSDGLGPARGVGRARRLAVGADGLPKSCVGGDHFV